VAHSRTILESRLFEDYMLKYVFTELADNGGDGDDEEIKVDSKAPRDRKKEYHDKIIGPILINCIHLFTFVFNDLP
jgi:hypothetical protein